MKRRRIVRDNRRGADATDAVDDDQLQDRKSPTTGLQFEPTQRKRRLRKSGGMQQSGGGGMAQHTLSIKQRMLQRQQRLLASNDPTQLDDSSNTDSEVDADESGGHRGSARRPRHRRVLDDDDDVGSIASSHDEEEEEEESLGSFIDEQEGLEDHQQLAQWKQQKAPLSDLNYWYPEWLTYLASCIADPHFAQQVARDDEYAQHYDTAMRAVEEYAWRGIRDGYSNAWKGADPGFLRALQVYPILRRHANASALHPIDALLRSDHCAACKRAHNYPACTLELRGPPGAPLWRHGLTAGAQLQQDLAIGEEEEEEEEEEGYEGGYSDEDGVVDENTAAAHNATASGAAVRDPISGAVLSPSNTRLKDEQVWRVGRFCVWRASLYHSLYHYKRHVAYTLACRLGQYMQQYGDDPDAAVDAVLQDDDLTHRLRTALVNLCGAAQTLQTGPQGEAQGGPRGGGRGGPRGPGAHWKGMYEGLEGTLRHVAQEMGQERMALGNTADWQAAQRAGGGEEEEEEEEEEGDDGEEEEKQQGRGAQPRRSPRTPRTSRARVQRALAYDDDEEEEEEGVCEEEEEEECEEEVCEEEECEEEEHPTTAEQPRRSLKARRQSHVVLDSDDDGEEEGEEQGEEEGEEGEEEGKEGEEDNSNQVVAAHQSARAQRAQRVVVLSSDDDL